MHLAPPTPLLGMAHWIESFSYLTGFVFVVTTLAGLWALTVACSALVRTFEGKPTPAAPGTPAAPAPAVAPAKPAASDALSPELIAVISAAITVAVGQPHTIVSIRPSSSGWTQEGRRQIFEGRKVR